MKPILALLILCACAKDPRLNRCTGDERCSDHDTAMAMLERSAGPGKCKDAIDDDGQPVIECAYKIEPGDEYWKLNHESNELTAKTNKLMENERARLYREIEDLRDPHPDTVVDSSDGNIFTYPNIMRDDALDAKLVFKLDEPRYNRMYGHKINYHRMWEIPDYEWFQREAR